MCGVSGVTLECEQEHCLAVMHPWCLESQGLLSKAGFLCPQHSNRMRSDHPSFFPTAILLDKPAIVKDFKQGESHYCTGTVFWYAFCTQYFPFADQLHFPAFEVWLDSFDDQDTALDGLQSSPKPIEQLEQELMEQLFAKQEEVASYQLEILSAKNDRDETDGHFFATVLGQFAIHKQMKAKTTEDDWVLKDIKMLQFKLSNKDYLKYFEEKERVVIPEPQSRCARSLEPPKCEEDIVCCVCGDGDYEEDNLIVICESCELGAHMRCYGIPAVPEGDWYCDVCQAYGKEGACRLPCLLCPNNGGGLKATLHLNDGLIGNYPKYDPNFPDSIDNPKHIWCHLFCMTRMPGVLIKDKPRKSGFSLSNLDATRYKQKCEVCGTRKGACLQCSHKKCSLAFHPECGKSFFLFARDKGETGVFCSQHRTLKLRQFLEHKEKKQVDEIVVFFRKWEAWGSRQGRKRRRELEFSSEESLQLIEVLEGYLRAYNAARVGFEVHISLNSRKVVTRTPVIYHLVDPNILTDKDLHIPGRTAEECKQYYSETLFHLLKQEQELVCKPVAVLFSSSKPQRKAKVNKPVPKPKRIIEETRKKQRKCAPASINLFPIFLPPAKPKTTTEVFCVCRQPFIEELPRLVGETDFDYEKKVRDSSMISCMQCEEWYHLGCVGYLLSAEEAEKDESWRCHECRLTTNVKFSDGSE